MAESSSSLSSIGELILRSRKSLLSPNSIPLDSALGAAASMGLSLAIVRWLWTAFRPPAIESDASSEQEEVIVVKRGLLDAFMGGIRRYLRRLLLDPDEIRQFESIKIADEVHVVDSALITHQGSCHCRSVRFEIRAPRMLVAKEGPGKIQYRHTEMKSSNFRVVRGQGHLRTYYVETSQDRGAHAFCERCGCHILFAPSRSSTRLLINVNCIDEGIRKIKVVDTKSSISTGMPMERQWDDQLTTISEVAHDAHIQINQNHNHSQFRNLDSLSTEGSTEWKLYDELDKLEPTAWKSYYPTSRTPTTISSSFTAQATDTQSLPAIRIPHGASDTASIMTESDVFSVTHSEFGLGGSTSKPLPILRDQMKYYMKKHVSPNAKKDAKKEFQKTSSQ